MRTIVAIAALALAQHPATARGQELELPAARQGSYFSLGAQGAAAAYDDDTLGSLGGHVGTHVSLRVGQLLTERFGLGVGLWSDIGASGGWSSFGGGLSIEGQFVPWRALALRAGIGLGALALGRRDEAEETDDDPSGAFGTRYHAAVSYDWFPFYSSGGSGGFAVTFLTEGFVLPGDGIIGGGVLFGLELTYFGGLSKRHLAAR